MKPNSLINRATLQLINNEFKYFCEITNHIILMYIVILHSEVRINWFCALITPKKCLQL